MTEHDLVTLFRFQGEPPHLEIPHGGRFYLPFVNPCIGDRLQFGHLRLDYLDQVLQ